MFFESVRNVPRRRRWVAPWVLVVLWPLFHYDDWRDAWVLRVIGRHYGPVLIKPEPERRPEDWGEWEPSRLRRMVARAPVLIPGRASHALPVGGSALVVILGAAVVLAAAALGFTVAPSTDRTPKASALDAHASTGLLRLSFPSAWRREAPTAVPRAGFSDEIALTPSAASGETLVIGRTATPNPQLLPPSLLAALPSVPIPGTIHLGGATFYRYLNLSSRGQHNSESVYAMSTTAGTVLGVCTAPDFRTSFISKCEQSLGTLALKSGKMLPPGPIPAYASTLSVAIRGLNSVRTRVGAQLRTATAARAQAKAAYALAAAHAQAATILSRLNAGPANLANASVVAALKLTDAAYRALGQAASHDASARYRQARALVTRAAAALTAAYSRLHTFGYSIT